MWDEFGKPIGIAFAFLIACCSILMCIANQVEWVSASVTIEQLRADARRVDVKMAEDVAGQVAVVNQKIVANQRWRKTIFRVFLPSGWDNVKLIEMPKSANYDFPHQPVFE